MEATSEVEAKVTLQYEAGSLTPPRGSSALVNTTFKVVPPPGTGCTTASARGGGTFTVISLNWLTASDSVADQVGHVEDILLRYDTGRTTETATDCSGEMPSGWWSRFFLGTHIDEASMAESDPASGFNMPAPNIGVGLAYLGTGWKVSGGELFAELEWKKNIDFVTEEGSFKLYHRPEEQAY